jgi:YD repeat-containing protein
MKAPLRAGFFICALVWVSLPAVGNVKQHTTFKGEVVTYDYDSLNRLATKNLPGGNTVMFTYTVTGQVATTADTRGTTRYTYDARDRLTQVSHPEGWVVSYGYDATSNRASLTTQYKLEAAKVTGYEYDRANRLTKVPRPNVR